MARDEVREAERLARMGELLDASARSRCRDKWDLLQRGAARAARNAAEAALCEGWGPSVVASAGAAAARTTVLALVPPPPHVGDDDRGDAVRLRRGSAA